MCSDDHVRNVWYTQCPAKTWRDILSLYENKYSGPPSDDLRWVFRGDRLDDDRTPADLKTKLEQVFDLYDVPYDKKEGCELETVRAFQRRAALYLEHEPDKDDILEWLALMRHHGAPVRLLDCTYSFYLAVYMALAENSTGAVWAINAAKFNKPRIIHVKIEAEGNKGQLDDIRRKLRRKDDILNIRSMGDKLDDLAIISYVMKNPLPLLYAVNPFRLNRRLTMQQGVLLLVGDPKATFRENLASCFTDSQDLTQNVHATVLDVSKSERNRILWELKKMNISNDVLFPGLDGFAKSLGERLAYREVFPAHA